MLTKDIYGKDLSTEFITAVDSFAQKVKPKVMITLLDSRHVDNLTITQSPVASNTIKGTYSNVMDGFTSRVQYFFKPENSMSGIEREAFPWAVCDYKDIYGKTIKADGNWYVMPDDLEDNNKFGWVCAEIMSNSTPNGDGEYPFSSNVYVEYTFDERKVNKIKINTSEFYGKVASYQVLAYNNTLSAFYTDSGTFARDEYSKVHVIPESVSNDVNKIRINILTTQNKEDYARITEVVPLYELDITDYVISHSVDRQGELWENSIPIAGSGSSSASIILDNTSKDFNPFDPLSTYGKYMKKDLKINISNGWRILKTNEVLVNTTLTQAMTNSSSENYIYVSDATGFSEGSSENPFLLIIGKGTVNEEMFLCRERTDKRIRIKHRGYSITNRRPHSVGDIVTFDPYEYVNGGEFYVDEWSGGSSMQVNIKCIDKSKFLLEKQITKGFYVQNSTVGDAIENLLMSTNISKNEFDQIEPFTSYAKKNAIALYSFNDASDIRDGAAIVPGTGLRCRIWKMKNGEENKVKDIKADSLDVQLSDYDKAMGAKPYIQPSFTAYSGTTLNPMNANTLQAVNMVSFSYTDNGIVNDQYYNGVIDGYYIPLQSGEQAFELLIANGGVRMYLDDTIIMDYWNSTGVVVFPANYNSYNYMGRYLDLDAGVPYKIRIEFFHAEGSTPFGMSLSLGHRMSTSGLYDYLPVLTSSCTTVVAEDSIGSRNTTFTKTLKNRNHYRNSGKYINFPTLNINSGLVSEPNNKAIYTQTGKTYQIGDIGPAGGRVFITPSTIGNTTGKYFEVAPYSSDFMNRFWSQKVPIDYTSTAVSGADGVAIGTGYQNTLDIIAQNTNTFIAARFAADFSLNGYDDWFLPSQDELQKVYEAFPTSYPDTIMSGYWSSTEVSATNARSKNFGLNQTLSSPKEFSKGAIPVRSFTPSPAYIEIPYDESLNLGLSSSSNYTNEFTYEIYVKFNNGTFPYDGTYLTNETIVSSEYFGHSFFYNNSGHGFIIHTPSGSKTVVSDTGIDTDKWDHICVTYKEGVLSYYHDGTLVNSIPNVTLKTFGLGNTIIGNSTKNFYIDEYIVYNKALDADTIKKRYISTQIKELTSFPHLYGNEQSAKSIIDSISLADFGRFYVDENDKFKYNHFYRFFEPSITQHSVVQKTINSNSHIISGEYNVQLQVNKVTVSVTEQNPMITSRQGIWTATPDPSTLGVVKLIQNISSTANTIPVTTTDRPPFPSSGYLKIQDEIIKYSAIDSTNFLGVERGQFDTVASEHYANDLVREARFYDIKYDNSPAFNIQKPLVTAITNTYPPEIEIVKFSTNAYTAQLLLVASSSVAEGDLAFIQGTNARTGEVDYTAIAGVPIKKQDSSSLIKKQSASLSSDIRKYGLKEVVIENEYIYSAKKAQEIADFLISKFAEPVPILNITSMAIPTLQIGDRIRISNFESLDILDTDYWVVSHSLNVGDTLDHSIVLRKVI